MRVPIVFVDANVLYSKTLRDWLFLLRKETCGDMFTVASSNDVIAEVLYRIRRNNLGGPGHLTSNVKEKLEESLVHSADSFFQLIAENVPQVVDDVIRTQIAYYRRRSSSKALRDALLLAHCPTFAEIVHRHVQAMSTGSTTSGIARVRPVVAEDAAENLAVTERRFSDSLQSLPRHPLE